MTLNGYSQKNKSILSYKSTIKFSNAQRNLFSVNNSAFSSYKRTISFSDTICNIKIMDNCEIKEMMDSLAIKKNTDECLNSFAIDVMKARLTLLREISHERECDPVTMDDIRCILYNLYCLTGIKHSGDHDLIGYRFLAPFSVTQYEEWLELNCEKLCIDLNTRLLFIVNEPPCNSQ